MYQDVIVANPKMLKKQMKLRFIVDTGCSGCAIPQKLAKKLKLKAIGQGNVQLADGSIVKVKIAYMYMRIGGEHVFTLVTFNGGDEPLLGFDVMSMLQLQLDPHNKKILKPLRRSKLLSFFLGKHWISNRGKCKQDG
jgi:clan AA aspartic protease